MPDIETEFNEIEQRLVNAWLNRDWDTVDAILDDGWMVTDPSGRVLTKAQVLAEAKSGERKLDSGVIDDVTVRNFGDCAVVTGRTTASGTYQGNQVSVKLRFTDVFINREGEWRAVASQATLLPQAKLSPR